KTNRSIADFNWEFMEGPWGPAIYVIAVDESETRYTKVVGIQCAIPIELKSSGGKVLRTAKSEDTLVDPAYRGQKIFERMYDLLFESCRQAGIQYIWGFTPARKAFERIGFEIPFMANQALLALNPVKSYRYLSALNPANRAVDKMKIAALSLLSRLTAMKAGTLPSSPDISFRAEDIAPIDDIVGNTPDLYYLNMDRRYVEWRMVRNPFGNDYRTYRFYHQEKPVANAIINLRKNGIGYLEQVLFLNEPPVLHRKIVIRQLVDLMRKEAHTIRVLCFDVNDALKSQQELLATCSFTLLKLGSFSVWKADGPPDVRPTQLFLSRLFTQGNQ